ncbi:MAG: hypothetical protein LBP23_01050 [Treponema sp.]|jgi:hypothetical protein|nr:hypothetical protein [Treponema sp.]
MRRCFFSIVILCIAAVSASAEAPRGKVKPFTFPQTRHYGYGGPHVAYTDDFTTLWVNPAFLRDVKELAITELSVGVHGDIFGLGELVMDAMDSDDFDTGKVGEFSSKSGGKIPVGLDVRFPFSGGYVGRGIGFGIFNRTSTNFELVGTTLSADAAEDLVLKFGMAFDLLEKGSHDLNVGFMANLYGRGTISVSGGFLDMVNDTGALVDKSPVQIIVGAGADLGFKYVYRDNLTAGLVLDDLISPCVINSFSLDDSSSTDTDFNFWAIIPRLNLGVSYTFHPFSWMNIGVMADYRDMLNLFYHDYSTRNPILNLGIGTEIGFLDHIFLRAGLNDMLPALGIGFDLVACKLDFAYYGKELGNEPGKLSTYALDLGLLFRY